MRFLVIYKGGAVLVVHARSAVSGAWYVTRLRAAGHYVRVCS